MTKFVPLRHQTFGGKTWKRTTTFQFAAKDQVVPLVAQELASAAPEMPVGLIKQGEKFALVALLSFKPNDNLFVDPSGKWMVQYTPAVLRTYPFRFARDQATSKLVLCVDDEQVHEARGEETFFDENGRPSEAITRMLQTLEALERSRQATAVAVAALAEQGLIIPWEIKIQTNAKAAQFNWLHKIDEAALNKLPDEAFLKLRKVGAIPLAYAQLMSMQQLHLLSKLVSVQQQLRTDPKLQISQTQLNEMFKLDDGTLQF